jgi:SAM-dependent methyltransferase
MSSTFQCRSCQSESGQLVLDLGEQPLANNLMREEDLARPEPRFPLRLLVCQSCWLMQLGELVPPVRLFADYPYFSSVSQTFREHVAAAAGRYLAEFGLGAGHRVIEIASNDGCFLEHFRAAGVPALGIEPAANVAAVARARGIETVVEFFGQALANRLKAEGRQADLVLGNNVFAHAPEINDFVAGLGTVLKPGGRIILEFPYAVDFLRHTEFDTIYHEHVYYLALTPLVPLFHRHGLEILAVERLTIHGGSLRLFAGRPGEHGANDSVSRILETEREEGLGRPETYAAFAANARELRTALVSLLGQLKAQGKRIAAYGASAKGSTLLNFCGLGRETLEFIADRSVHKQGKYAPGTRLPIVAVEELESRRPDYAVLLTWNFEREILAQQQAYRARGGRFIVPIPEVRIV